MFNTSVLNLKPFNTSVPATQSFSGVLQYNGYSLPNQNILVTRIGKNFSSGAMVKDIFDKANNHGEWLRNYFYKEKYIDVYWVIVGSSASDLVEQIHSLVSAISKENGVLKLALDNWVILTGIAHCDWWNIERQPYNITFVPFNFRLVCLNPFLTWTITQEVSFASQTASFTDVFAYTWGTYKTSPTITIVFWTWLWSPTSVSVDIGWQEITLSQAISDSDIVIINCESQDISYNGVWWQDFTWIFPELELWDNEITVTIDSTWTADINITRYNTYV